MTRREKILAALQSLARTVQTGSTYAAPAGFTTNEIATAAGVLRSNCSAELNALVREELVEKTTGRPTLYRPTWNNHFQFLLQDHLSEAVDAHSPASRVVDEDFDWGVATYRSLHDAVQQAKMAVTYPPQGMHVLLLGETGVGKSTFARKMHEYAIRHGVLRADAPFVTFNCAEYANNPEILLDQLFGHVRGAYSGAHSDKPGLVDQANDGVLFLDEVHRLPPQGQEMLFHLLDYGRYRRLGETQVEQHARVLLVAATTETPESVLLSTFRRRIPVVIHLPALRDWALYDRYELVYSLCREEARLLGRAVRVSARALDVLLFTRFAANIGDLKNVLKLACARAFGASPGAVIDVLSEHVVAPADGRNEILLGSLAQSSDLFVSPDGQGPPPLPMLEEGSRYAQLGRLSQTLYELGFDTEEILESLGRELQNQDQTDSLVPSSVADLRQFVGEPLFSSMLRAWQEIETSLPESEREAAFLRVSIHLSGVIRSSRQFDQVRDDGLYEVVERVRTDFPELYRVAGQLLEVLTARAGVVLPDYEAAIVAMLLRPHEGGEASRVGIVVALFGDSIARQLAEAATKLTEGPAPTAIDIPFQTTVEVMDVRLTEAVHRAEEGRGVLLLTDVPRFATGGGWTPPPDVQIERLLRPDLHTVIGAVLGGRSGKMSHNELAAWLRLRSAQVATPAKKRVVWGCCLTGKGTARAVVRLIREALPTDLYEQVEVIPKELGHADAALVPDDGLVATVGSVNPNIFGVPFFSVETLLTKAGIDRLLNVLYLGDSVGAPASPLQQRVALANSVTSDVLVNDDANPDTTTRTSLDDGNDSLREMETYVLKMLRRDLVFLNPDLAWRVSREAWERVNRALVPKGAQEQLKPETVVRFCLHVAYAIERMVKQADLLHPYPKQIAQRYPTEWALMEDAWQPIIDVFRIPVNEHELAYLVEFMFANRSLEVFDE